MNDVTTENSSLRERLVKLAVVLSLTSNHLWRSRFYRRESDLTGGRRSAAIHNLKIEVCAHHGNFD